MKRIICAVLCLVMILCAEGSLGAASYTLPEKMNKQLSIGSGLKGEITLHGEGNDPWLLGIQPLLNVPLQLRGLSAENQSHFYAYQAGENEEQIGLTEIYLNGSQTFFRSDLLPGEVFLLPGMENAADLMFPSEGGNPSLASALVRWIQLPEDRRSSLLDPVVNGLSGELEVWASRFVSSSEVRAQEDGTSAVDLIYDIPMAELKKEAVVLWTRLISSDEGQALLNALLDEEQKKIFGNVNLGYFYEEALSALDNNYDVMYTQTVSTLGTPISSTLEFPLDEDRMGFQTLVIEQEGGMSTYTLRGEERDVTLQVASVINWDEISSFSAWICIRPGSSEKEIGEGEYHALRFDVSQQSELSTDEEARDHLRTTWMITAERDVSRLPEGEREEDYPEEPPIQAELRLHYYSKYSQSSPTTLEFEAAFSREDLAFSAEGKVKTASPWILSPFAVENPVDVTTLAKSQLVLKTAEFMAAAAEKLVPEKTEGTDQENAGSQPESVESDGTMGDKTAEDGSDTSESSNGTETGEKETAPADETAGEKISEEQLTDTETADAAEKTEMIEESEQAAENAQEETETTQETDAGENS